VAVACCSATWWTNWAVPVGSRSTSSTTDHGARQRYRAALRRRSDLDIFSPDVLLTFVHDVLDVAWAERSGRVVRRDGVQ